MKAQNINRSSSTSKAEAKPPKQPKLDLRKHPYPFLTVSSEDDHLHTRHMDKVKREAASGNKANMEIVKEYMMRTYPKRKK